eukprot:COSAG05_NODE_26582_length_186_cov_38.298851_1_plen_47_part_10
MMTEIHVGSCGVLHFVRVHLRLWVGVGLCVRVCARVCACVRVYVYMV